RRPGNFFWTRLGARHSCRFNERTIKAATIIRHRNEGCALKRRECRAPPRRAAWTGAVSSCTPARVSPYFKAELYPICIPQKIAMLIGRQPFPNEEQRNQHALLQKNQSRCTSIPNLAGHWSHPTAQFLCFHFTRDGPPSGPAFPGGQRWIQSQDAGLPRGLHARRTAFR